MKNEKRPLNMEEKRRLEKIIIGDIESAQRAYTARRHNESDELEKKLKKNLPASVKQLFTSFVEARKETERAEKELEKLGYEVSTYGGNTEISIRSYGDVPAEMRKFHEETTTREKKFEALKRAYTIKLFAGGAEAQELFDSLQTEIAKLTA